MRCYGGSKTGRMGNVADAVLAAGGEVIGVMTTHLQKRGLAHASLTEIHFVDSMHIRKAKMAELADAFIALPGGAGTLDEYFEVF
ncbi:LOG family protein, partial [Bacillus cereus]|uniref:LOG family protein n=1 Tax=Bacillus cereus TaxID=1396 RepID=UPI0020BF3902